jgi:hypothetical protein
MKQIMLMLLFAATTFMPSFQVLAQSCTPASNCSNSTCGCSGPCSSGGSVGVGNTLLAECSSTGTYNCHQYTRAALYTNAGFGTLIPNCPSNVSCPCSSYPGNRIDNDPAFVPLCSNQMSLAQAVFYDNDHSGVFNLSTSNTNDIVSKWNHPGPLVSHDKDYYPGVQSFFAFIGAINGTTNLTSASNFSVTQRSGVTYSWTAVPADAVTITNATGSTATITPKCSTSVQIFLTATACGGSRTQCMTITSSPSSCSNCTSTIVGTYNGSNSLNTFNSVSVYATTVNVSCVGANSFTWTKTSGAGSIFPSGSSCSVYLNAGQSVNINIVARNTNQNCTISSRTVAFSRGSGWLTDPGNDGELEIQLDDRNLVLDNAPTDIVVAPNPTSGEVFLYANREDAFQVTVFDQMGRMVRFKDLQTANYFATLDLSDQPDGLYMVQVRDTGNIVRTYKVALQR